MKPHFGISTIAVLVVYYLVSIVAGIYKTRKLAPSDYITAPNSTNWIYLTLTLIATVVGGGMFFGVAQEGFEKGLVAFSLGIAYFTGSIAIGLLAPTLRKYARENKVTTLFGVIDVLYPDEFVLWRWTTRLSNVFSVVCFLVFLLMLSAQFVAIGTYVSFFSSTDFTWGVIVGSVLLAVFSTFINGFIGGFTRDVLTDVIQMIFIFLGVGAILYFLDLTSLGSQMAALPRQLFTLRSSQLVEFFGALIFIPLTFFVRFDLWQRIITAKSDKQARVGFYISGILCLFFFLFFCFLGLYGRGVGIVESKYVGMEVIEQVVTSPFAAALTVAMFCAAIISTADTFLGVAGLSVAKTLFYKKGELETPAESGSGVNIRTLRLTTLVIGLVSIGFALLVRNIVDLFATAFGFLLVFFPAFIFGFLSHADSGRKHRAAKASVMGGVAALALLFYFAPRVAWFPSLLISLGVYFIVVRPPRPRDEE